MRQKKAKQIRRILRSKRVAIAAEPYTGKGRGGVLASRGRRTYQMAKSKTIKELEKIK